jgi:geranylgeranyl pyrophosphate synthase
MYLSSAETRRQLDLESLRKNVADWFTQDAVGQILGPASSQTEKVAQQWLVKGGKRWRPFLAVCAARALGGDSQLDELSLRRLALAVECFHKASLIHDDIEDDDQTRYEDPTLHARYGVGFALNAGDFLLGEGYRLIGLCDVSDDRKVKMYEVAALGHRDLSLGQGAELWWSRKKDHMKLQEVLEIFQRKTAPAFEVALRMGAIFGRGDDALGPALTQYSRALGIAYQIRDDLDDFCCASDSNDLEAGRLSVLPALALEQAGVPTEKLQDLYEPSADKARFRKAIDALGDSRAVLCGLKLMEAWKRQAVQALEAVDSVALKSLLRRVVGRIFCDFEVMGCCDDVPGRDASGRQGRD